MKNAVIMQARTGSSRLPGKVLKVLKDKTVLEHDIMRIQQARLIDGIIIATTVNDEDDRIVEIADKCGVYNFRGSQDDVLERYYYAAKKFQVENIIRITSDCPLIDPHIIDEVVNCYNQNPVDIMTNVPNEWEEMSYPRGMDLEIFPFVWLEKAFNEAQSQYDREHVSPYIYDHARNRYYYKYSKNYSKYRLTLDTDEDWEVISRIYDHFYKGKHDFYMEDIIGYLDIHKEISVINQKVEQQLKH